MGVDEGGVFWIFEQVVVCNGAGFLQTEQVVLVELDQGCRAFAG